MPGPEARDRVGDFSSVVPFKGRDIVDSDASLERQAFPREFDQTAKLNTEQMSQLASEARECFPLGVAYPYSLSPKSIRPRAMIARRSKTNYFAYANEYLQEVGVSPEEIAIFFNERGNWDYDVSDISDIYSLRSYDADTLLKEAFKPINRIIDRSLDGVSPDGFNKHGELHSNRVVKQELVLLDYIGAEDAVKRDAVIAGRAHDIGCVLARDPHAYISQRMLQVMLPSIKEDPERYKRISKAIIFHDSDTLGGITSRWNGLSSDERLQKLADFMRPEGLALLMADKIEIGRDRISDKVLAGSLIKDPHAVANLLGRHDSLEPRGDALVWTLKYNPTFTDKEMRKFKHFAEGWKRRRESGEVNITFQDWQNVFWRIYTNRVITLAESALAFFPFMDRVDIQMVDQQTGDESQVVKIHRGSLDRNIAELKDMQVDLLR